MRPHALLVSQVSLTAPPQPVAGKHMGTVLEEIWKLKPELSWRARCPREGKHTSMTNCFCILHRGAGIYLGTQVTSENDLTERSKRLTFEEAMQESLANGESCNLVSAIYVVYPKWEKEKKRYSQTKWFLGRLSSAWRGTLEKKAQGTWVKGNSGS